MAMNLDPTLTPVAVDTLGELGKTVEGKQVLHKTGNFVCVEQLKKRMCKFYICLPSCCETTGDESFVQFSFVSKQQKTKCEINIKYRVMEYETIRII